MTNSSDAIFMKQAIELGRKTAFDDNAGGPFGCVIVKNDQVVGEGANRVLAENDPTCHGEISAIRSACSALGTHDLSGSTMYTSSEPCPMCYAAAWWARIDKIYYGSTSEDSLTYGKFDDLEISNSFKLPGQERSLPCVELLREEMIEIWEAFSKLDKRPEY